MTEKEGNSKFCGTGKNILWFNCGKNLFTADEFLPVKLVNEEMNFFSLSIFIYSGSIAPFRKHIYICFYSFPFKMFTQWFLFLFISS